MSTSDIISSIAAILSLLSIIISLKSYKESRRSNEISLIPVRLKIYNAFSKLVISALTEEAKINETAVNYFRKIVPLVESNLPEEISQNILSFFADCERLVFTRSLTPPIDKDYIAMNNAALQRIRNSAISIEESLKSIMALATK